VVGTFRRLEKFLDIVVAEAFAKAQRPWLNLEGLALLPGGTHQANPEEMIDGFLPGIDPGAPHLFSERLGDVFIEGKGGSHIMMLT
jgi:hypothetical protein